MKYRLYYQELEIGTIIELDHDFPNTFGEYKLIQNLNKKSMLISQYVQYSVRASILMESNEKEWQEFMYKEELKFVDLIESEDWRLIDEKEEIHNILIPNFCHDNRIVWRWNF